MHIISATRPDPDFNLRKLAPRIGKIIGEVLLQAQVIRERPAAGVAHALVFWGFCAFALITVNHIATGFGIPILARTGGFGPIYFGFAALFAIAVAAAIMYLAARRFIERPVWFGDVSPESGIIAGLIFLLMITYLAGFALSETSATAHAIWWTHTLALLVFLPLIPQTKHLHLILSPATIFLKRPVFSDIPKLAGDEDFGLVAGKDITRIEALQSFSCVECGRCTEHCPAYNTGKVLNPKVILGLRAYLNTEGPASETPLLGAHISEEAVFQCTTCEAPANFSAPVGIQHLPVIIGLRRGYLVNTGRLGRQLRYANTSCS